MSTSTESPDITRGLKSKMPRALEVLSSKSASFPSMGTTTSCATPSPTLKSVNPISAGCPGRRSWISRFKEPLRPLSDAPKALACGRTNEPKE